MFKLYLLTNKITNFFFKKRSFFLLKKEFFLHKYLRLTNRRIFWGNKKEILRKKKKRKSVKTLNSIKIFKKLKKFQKSPFFKTNKFNFKSLFFKKKKIITYRPFFRKIFFFKRPWLSKLKYGKKKFRTSKFHRRWFNLVKCRKYFKKFRFRKFRDLFYRKNRKHFIFRGITIKTLPKVKPMYNLKKSLKVALFSQAKFRFNIIKYIIPNLIIFQNKFKSFVYNTPVQKKKIFEVGRKVLKKRYRFRRIFRKRFFLRKFFIAKDYRNINAYKPLRLINFNYKDYKVYNFFKKNIFYQSFLTKTKICLPNNYSRNNLKALRVCNIFNYYTNFWKY